MSGNLWIHKYRPTTLDEFVGDEFLKRKIADYIETNNPPHLFLYSEEGGTGKTTLAEIMMKTMDCLSIMLKGSEQNLTAKIRNEFGILARLITDHQIKLGIVDECDTLPKEGQTVLRWLIDDWGHKIRFILTSNDNDFPQPFMSRFQKLVVIPPSEGQVLEHVSKILDVENIRYKSEVLAELVRETFPSIRETLNEVQLNIIDGELKPPIKKYYEVKSASDFWR